MPEPGAVSATLKLGNTGKPRIAREAGNRSPYNSKPGSWVNRVINQWRMTHLGSADKNASPALKRFRSPIILRRLPREDDYWASASNRHQEGVVP